VLAGLLVLVLLVLNVLAASSKLHELIHDDAGSATHQCAVTLFAHGQVDAATADVSAIIPPVSIEPAPQVSFFAFAPAIENLPAGRAPPFSSSKS
jgi:hypothetical protein